MKRVVVAEDQAGLRGLICELLREFDDIELAGEAADGQALLELAQQERPDVLVIDLGLPLVDGERALKQLRASLPNARLVVLSGQASAIIQPRLYDLGADAVIEKGAAGWEARLVGAVRE